MEWNSHKFEEQMQISLKGSVGDTKGGEMFAVYQVTRNKLLKNVFTEIKGAEPQLSDHGPDHIANVLDNAHALLRENGSLKELTGVEMYLLGMMILFHDVGNLYGRKNHHTKIAEIFDWARGTAPGVRHEKVLVLNAARAHTGKANNGSYDTLREIGQQDHLDGQRIRLQELAAILRLADELAEGPQRTSEFMLEKGLYTGDSAIYHEYASITHVCIDRGTGRILLSYEIPVDPSASGAWKNKLCDLVEFVYKRALKLDQERRYARFYSSLLNPFRETSISLHFHCKGQVFDIAQSPLKLDDKVVPGDSVKPISEIDSAYDVETLLAALTAQLGEAQQ